MPQAKRNEESKTNQVSSNLVRRFELLDDLLRSYLQSDTNPPCTPGPSRPPKTLDQSRNKNYCVQISKVEDCKAFGQCVTQKLKNLDPASAYDLEQQILKVLISPEIENPTKVRTNNAVSPDIYSQDKQLDDVSFPPEPNELVIKEQTYTNEEPEYTENTENCENTENTFLETAGYFESLKLVLENSDFRIPELSEVKTQLLPERNLRISITSDNNGKTEEIVQDLELVEEPLESYIDNLSHENKYKYIDLTGPLTFKSENTEFARRRRFVSLETFENFPEEIHSSSVAVDIQGSSQNLLTPEQEKLTRRERKRRLKAKQQEEKKKGNK